VQADYTEVNPSPRTDAWPKGTGSQQDSSLAAANPGLRLTPSEVSLAEGGDPVTYQAVLRKRPSAPVVVSISPGTQTAVSPEVLIFAPGEWNRPQDVSVWAEDDRVVEGLHSGTVTHFMASTDPQYVGLTPEVVTATIEDNDSVGIRVSPTSVTVAEPDGSAVLTYSLASTPSSSVTIPLVTSSDECSVIPPAVVLDSENWQSGAEVTVSAQDDSLNDGDQTCLVQGGPSSSSDAAYNGLSPQDVTVTVLDDDEAWRAYLPVAAHHWPPLPEVPILLNIVNTDGNGSYSVRWDPARRAETYVLEEAKVPDFVSAQEIYSGQATEYEVDGQGAARLFYRVKARNGWGDSSWSQVQQVDVLWEAEPNDDASILTNGPLVPGLLYFGLFSSEQDIKDYFYFDLASAGTVRLWLDNIPDGRNYDLVLRDEALETEPGWYSVLPGNQDEYVEATIPAGRYHVQIFNASDQGSNQPYRLTIQY
jgi:hypothetical protein